MNVFLKRINQNKTLVGAATIIAGSLLFSQILGFIRQVLINTNFNSWTSGAYFVAFEIPDFFFYTLSGATLSVVLMPVLSDKIFASRKKEAWQLASSFLNYISLLMIVVCLALIIFPYQILDVLAPGFQEDPSRLHVAAQIMRLVAINPLVFSISSILSSIQQIYHRFFFLSAAPIIYYLSIIASIFLFKSSMGIVGLGIGVAGGSLLYLVILGLGMNKLNFKHVWRINFKNKAFVQIRKSLWIRSFDQGITYINSLIHILIATTISVAAPTNFKNALTLFLAPILLFGTALSMPAFSRFTKKLSQGRPDLFKKEFLSVLKMMIWIITPITIVAYFCRDLLTYIVYPRDNQEIALVLGWMSIGIFFKSLHAIISRFYYAQKDNLTPLLVTTFIFFSNIFLSWMLVGAYKIAGLGMVTSILAILQIVMLLLIIQLRNKRLFNAQFLKGIAAILIAAGGTIIVAYVAISWLPLQTDGLFFESLLKLTAVSAAIFSSYFLISYCLRVHEAQRFSDYLRRMIIKRVNKLFVK